MLKTKFTLFKIRLLLFSVVLGSTVSLAQENNNFQHLTKTFSYYSEFQFDSLGYLWIATFDGLYRYDGYEYQFIPNSEFFGDLTRPVTEIFFEKDKNDNFWLSNTVGGLVRLDHNGNSITFEKKLSGTVKAMLPAEKQVFFATDQGVIYTYDYSSESMSQLTAVPKNTAGQIKIQSIALTTDSVLWVSAETGEIYSKQLMPEGSQWQELKGPFRDPTEPRTRIVSDGENHLYIAAENMGLYSYDIGMKTFAKLNPIVMDNTSESKPLFLSIYYDKNAAKVWAGTDGNGLYRYDIQTDEVTILRHKQTNNGTISNNTVREIISDNNKNIWIVTKNGVVDILPYQDDNISYYSASENGAPNSVLSVLVANDESIWMGTDGEGVNRVFADGTDLQYTNKGFGTDFFEGRYVQTLAEDAKGRIWLGTYRNGLYTYSNKSDLFIKKDVEDRDGNPISDIRTIFIDSKERIWISSNAGLHLLSKTGAVMALYEYGSNGIYGSISETITETSSGTIWIGVTDSGLFRYIEKEDSVGEATFQNIQCESHSNKFSNGVNLILADEHDNLYVKTMPEEIFYYNTKSHTCESYSRKYFSGNIVAQSFLLDDNGQFWMGSMNGLFAYDKVSNTQKSYFLRDGLQGNAFRKGAFKSKTGKLFFGGLNGLSSFYPQDIKQKIISPKLHITRINLLNKPAMDLIPEQVPNKLSNVKALDLAHNQSSFSFQFSVIDDLLNTNFNYAYRLKGFDKEWITSNTQRTAVYTKVPSGEYFFEVKAGTKRQNWDIEKIGIAINVAPPWWLSTWAYIIYFLTVGGLIFGIYRWAKLRSKLRMEEWAYQNEKEVYATKMNFFAKMSHEIQTPLSLILGPIEDMLQKAQGSKNRLLVQRLNLIKNNANRLSRISNELTTVRDKELHQLKLKVSKQNIIADLKIIALSFEEQARFKKIDFIKEFAQNSISVWYDRDKLEHVFYNLLSNAFKFTPPEGTIYLKVIQETRKQRLKISVIDSGPGIEKSELKEIFSMFYQSTTGKKLKGSGIGLALTKELVELHHGKIKVKSKRNQGSSFHVYLSTDEHIFTTEEKLLDTLDFTSITPINEEHPQTAMVSNDATTKEENSKSHILIVEDNVEMQIFLKDLLSVTYRVGVAENGKAGIEYLKTHSPDLIISDIMMPVMDGIEMSKALHQSKRWSHIPLMLLTAKNTTKSRLTGLESGAIAYINKPFETKEFLLRIAGILKNKENTISYAKTGFITNKQADLPPSKDHLFLEKLVGSLQEHMNDLDFKLESLTDIMGMSYSVILRNCQEIVGKTLVELYRSLKMKKAALLIIEQGFNVTEAGYAVGYRDAKYFSKCFKDEFGVPPQTMKSDSRKNGVDDLITRYSLKAS